MAAPHNPFKAALAAGRVQWGFWQSLASATVAEVSARAGFDWLLIDGEHGPNTLASLREQLVAIEATRAPVHPIARVVVNDTARIKQILDLGYQTVLVPLVETAGEAEAAARAMRYPPEGVRGAGVSVVRASGYGTDPDYLTTANREVCCLVQAETARAIDNLEAICAVEGVDGVFIGPSDLSVSLGRPGGARSPEVQAVIEDAIRRIRAAGKAPGILMPDPGLVARYLELGALFIAVGSDVATLAQGARATAERFRALAAG
ncbi:MAG: 4-hydroxy-2-oxo-heptane-1,7-dioate aldolase [Alphaproteobacteria bacterium]|nr:MAG: 4-hydroxy-2-oxo-heptane-1,7-dioate aldolase [Alphaproteobacteria bacterium]